MWIWRTAMMAMFLTAGFIVCGSAPAQADEMTWTITSKYQYKVQVAFYSRTRSHLWPANGQAWGLDDYAPHQFTLSCNAGEKICYGAWATGDATTYWGVGLDGKQYCSNCCSICGEENPVKTLAE
jgi:hypothetical protein